MSAADFYNGFCAKMAVKGFKQTYSKHIYTKPYNDDFNLHIRMLPASHRVRGHVYAIFRAGITHIPTGKKLAEIESIDGVASKKSYLPFATWDISYHKVVPPEYREQAEFDYYDGCDFDYDFNRFWKLTEKYVIPILTDMCSLDKILSHLDDDFRSECIIPIIYYQLHRYEEGIKYIEKRILNGGYSLYMGEKELANKIKQFLWQEMQQEAEL